MKIPVHKPRLISAYQQGLSLRECGRRFGIASSTVHFLLRRWGIQCRPQPLARKMASERYA